MSLTFKSRSLTVQTLSVTLKLEHHLSRGAGSKMTMGNLIAFGFDRFRAADEVLNKLRSETGIEADGDQALRGHASSKPCSRPEADNSKKWHEHISAPGSQSNSKTVVLELKGVDRVGYWRLAVIFANGFRIRVLHSRKTVRAVKMSKNLNPLARPLSYVASGSDSVAAICSWRRQQKMMPKRDETQVPRMVSHA
jgi:hypothetical protein